MTKGDAMTWCNCQRYCWY